MWFAFCGIASILLLSKSSSNGWLRYLHPCPMEIVCDVTDWCFGGFFFTALTMFLSSTAVVFLGQTVWCLFLSTLLVSFIFRTFQVVQAIPNACAMALNNFSSFLNFKMACFACSGLHIGSSFRTQMQSAQAKLKAKSRTIYCLTNQSNRTHLGKRKHLFSVQQKQRNWPCCSKTFWRDCRSALWLYILNDFIIVYARFMLKTR